MVLKSGDTFNVGRIEIKAVYTLGRMSAEALVIDARDRSAFMARHLPGALHAPLGQLFGTAIGSLVTDVATPLVLIVEESRVKEASVTA